MTEQELEKRKQRIMKIGKVGLLALVGFVVAPFIFLAIKGLIGLVVAAGIGLLLINITPVLMEKFANWRLKAIKAEAAKNPIETLQRDFGQRQDALQRFREAITTFSAATMTFGDKLDGFKEQFPKDATKFEQQLAKMKKLLDIRRLRYKEAEDALEQYAAEIDRAKAIWAMGLEAAKMNKAAGMTEEDFLAKIKVETALDSVQTSMNTAFAELETSLLEAKVEKEVLALGEGESERIDDDSDSESGGRKLERVRVRR